MLGKISDLFAAYKAAVLEGVAVLLLAGAFAAGWTLSGWKHGAEVAVAHKELAEQKAQEAAVQAAGALQSLKDVQAAAGSIQDGAKRLSDAQESLGTSMNLLRKDLKNVPKLPAGCVPGAQRGRVLDDAINRANAAFLPAAR